MRRSFLIVLLASLFFLSKWWNLSVPRREFFDEVYYVKAARELLQDRKDSNWVHPPLGKILIAAGIKAASPTPRWWRFSSLLAGTAVFLLTYPLAKAFGLSSQEALLSLLLLLTDFLLFVQSRIAMLDIFLTLFILLGFLFLLSGLNRSARGSGGAWLVAISGCSFGLALLVKWSALFAIGGALFLAATAPAFLPGLERKSVLPHLLLLIFLPFLVYLAIDYPIIAHWAARQKVDSRAEFISTHYHAMKFHLRPSMKHAYASHFLMWILDLRPVWYYFKSTKSGHSGVVGMGNPVLWWGTLVALLVALWEIGRRRWIEITPLIVTYFSLTLPYLLSAKGGFLFYLTPAVPFMALLSAASFLRMGKGTAAAFALLCCLAIVLYYPFLTGIWVPKAYFDHLMLFRSWI